jgi:cystathionine gamma-synthase
MISAPIGFPIPDTPHAVSVSLPTWASNIGYEEGLPEIVDKMKGGYPRFVFHPIVKKLISFCLQRFSNQNESCLIFNSRLACMECRQFIKRNINFSPLIRIAELSVPRNLQCNVTVDFYSNSVIYCLLFPLDLSSFAKQFWQHTGTGISSRYAEHCLRLLEIRPKQFSPSLNAPNSTRSVYLKQPDAFKPSPIHREVAEKEGATHIEERYGRNLDVRHTSFALKSLKKRIVGALGDLSTDLDSLNDDIFELVLADETEDISENVFLYPTGMTAIYNTLKLANDIKPGLKTVQFGCLFNNHKISIY